MQLRGKPGSKGPVHPQHDGKHWWRFFTSLHKSSWHLGGWNDSLRPFLPLLSDLHSPWGPGPGSSNRELSVLHDRVESGNLSVPNTEVTLQGHTRLQPLSSAGMHVDYVCSPVSFCVLAENESDTPVRARSIQSHKGNYLRVCVINPAVSEFQEWIQAKEKVMRHAFDRWEAANKHLSLT